MKAKQSRVLFTGVLLLSAFSFIYLNTIGMAEAGLSSSLIPENEVELPDAKVMKFILNHLIHMLHG